MNTTIKDTLEKTQWFPHTIDKVWLAITETEQVSKWLVPTDFKAEVGANYALKSPEDGCDMVTGKVIEANPYKLIYSWINASCNEVETIITWTLKSEKEGTSLTMIHSGISGYPNEVAPKMIESYTGGWERCFNNLGEILK
jgi:uncharacterized protein YndB with AHSA1/START domain